MADVREPCPINWRDLEADLRSIRPNEIIFRRGYTLSWDLRWEDRRFEFTYLRNKQ